MIVLVGVSVICLFSLHLIYSLNRRSPNSRADVIGLVLVMLSSLVLQWYAGLLGEGKPLYEIVMNSLLGIAVPLPVWLFMQYALLGVLWYAASRGLRKHIRFMALVMLVFSGMLELAFQVVTGWKGSQVLAGIGVSAADITAGTAVACLAVGQAIRLLRHLAGRKNISLISQIDASDCGPACIAMIANSFGRRVSITQVREYAGTDRSSTNLKGLIQAAEAVGLEARAVKGATGSLTSEVPVPCIAHITRGEQHHFVVICRIDEKSIWTADPDPDVGKARYSKEEFYGMWTGYLVLVCPGEQFRKQVDSPGLFYRFLPVLKPHVGTIANTVAASIVLTILGIAGAMYFRFLVDDILFSESRLTLHIISLGVVIITLLQVLLGAVREHMLLSFSMKVDASITLGFLRHLMHLPLSFFDSRKVGEILSRLGDTVKIREALSSAVFSVFFDTLMVVVIGAVLAVQNTRLFLIALLFVPLSGAIVWGFAYPFRRKYQEILSSNAESQALLVETVSGMATVKGHAAEHAGFYKIEKRIMKALWPQYRAGIMGNVQGVLVGLIDGWGGNILFWIGSVLILEGQVSLGQLISFNALLGYFLGPLQNLIQLQPSLQEAFVAARRVGEILDLDTEKQGSDLLKPEEVSGPIVFSGVNFRYGSKQLVLKDISFTVSAGESIGIVGPSGSGKSSLVKLLMKFYEPETGLVSINGIDLRDIDSRFLRQQIGYVSQDIFLFQGTVRDNIALGSPDASFEEITIAAKKAQAHEFITGLVNRYDTELSEQGSSLSGGERQRLAIARAMMGNPQIIIFDEATSNLDTYSEALLQDTIWKLKEQGITVCIVAHRLTTVTRCDRILVLESGRIIETGSHDQLIEQGGSYAKLWERHIG